MTPLAFDTETALIQVGRQAPPLTCISWAGEGGSCLGWVKEPNCYAEMRENLEDPQVLFVGLNVAYDFGVVANEWPDLLPLVFQAYANDRVTDVGLRQKLIDIAAGKFRGFTDGISEQRTLYEYSLAALAERFFGKKMDKSTHRLTFGELRDVPPEKWPEGAMEYAMEDAEYTYRIFQEQEKIAHLLVDQFRQARAAWGLHLISCWGIRTSEPQIQRFAEVVQTEYAKAVALCKEWGLVKPAGTRDTKAAKKLMLEVMAELGETPKKTDGFIEVRRKRDGYLTKSNGDPIPLTPRDLKNLQDPLFGIALDEDACLSSADDRLIAYSDVTSLTTVVKTHIPALLNGVKYPIQPRFDSLVETGRTSCKGHDPKAPTNGYQLQNVRRLEGIRECFVPREGFVFAEADYSGLELHTWAQTCLWALGESKLAQALNAKIDPHLVLASTMLEAPYEEALKRYKEGDEKVAGAQGARQFAKIGNFGFQGGMSPKTFRAWARVQFKTKFSAEQADFIRASWGLTWPEADPYFRWIKMLCDQGGGYATIKQWVSERVRGLLPFTVAANTFFQGLGGDVTKDALFAIIRECYLDCGTPLFGCRMVNYVHDSYQLEVPDDRVWADAAARRMVELMIEVGRKWLPDVPPRAEVTLARCWSKKAKAVYDEQGRLVPWEYRP